MFDAFTHINWLAVIAASVAQFLLGGVWFMVLFKRQYAQALDLPATAEAQKPAPLFILGPMLCGLVTVAVTAWLFRLVGVATIGEALVVGAVIGLGLIGTTTVNIAINPVFAHPFHYSLINVPYFLIGSLIASVILVSL